MYYTTLKRLSKREKKNKVVESRRTSSGCDLLKNKVFDIKHWQNDDLIRN